MTLENLRRRAIFGDNSETLSLLETVTAKGKTFFVNGRRVSRTAYIEAKTGKRLDCFVTRATKEAVRNYCTATPIK